MAKTILKSFKVGRQYSTADSIMESAGFKAERTVYEVIKRSENFVTLKAVKGCYLASVFRRKVYISESGTEYITSFETGLVRSVDAKSENVSAEVEMIDCIDEYIVDADAAAEVEITNASKANVVYTVRRFGKYGDSSCYSYNDFETAMQEAKNAIADKSFVAVQIIEGLNYSKPCFEWDIDAEKATEIKVVKVTESEIKVAVSKYKSIGKHFDGIMNVSIDEGLPNWEYEQKKLERRHYATENKAKVKFLSDFFKSIGVPRKALKISTEKDVVVKERVKEIELICFKPKTVKINQNQLEKIARYFEDDYTQVWVEEFIDGCDGEWDVLDEEDSEIEIEILPENTDENTVIVKATKVEIANAEEVKNLVEEIDSADYAVTSAAKNDIESTISAKATKFDEIKSKVEEQRKNHKSCIDWSALDEDNAKDFKVA